MPEYKWFRFYNEFSKDPKVQSMSEAMQRRLVMLFCFQCSGELQSLTDEEIAHAMMISIETLHETFHLFQSKKFINEKREICNWVKRQYLSDTSTNRVKKFREKQKLIKMKRFRNVTVTPPDTETDTETDKYFCVFWEKYPRQRRGDKDKTFTAWKKALNKATTEEILNGLQAYIGSTEVANGYAKGAAAWLNDSRWTSQYTQAGETIKPKSKPTLVNAIVL